MNNINQEIKDLEATLVSLKAKAKAQEPILTPVSFESKRELAKALVDGRTFKTSDGAILMYNDSCSYFSPFRLMQDGEDGVDSLTMLGAWDSYADLQEINAAPAEPWYLNIPEGGIECYVSDVDPNPYLGRNTKVLVTGYNQSLLYPFPSPLNDWKYATPINEGART